MKTKIFAIVLSMVTVVCSLQYVYSASPSVDEAEVAVAGYANTPANQKVGDRIAAILKANQIQVAGWTGSAGMTVNVPASQADKARRVLARAVLDEGLAVVIYRPASKDDPVIKAEPEAIPGLPSEPSPQADRVVVVAPEVILGLPPKH